MFYTLFIPIRKITDHRESSFRLQPSIPYPSFPAALWTVFIPIRQISVLTESTSVILPLSAKALSIFPLSVPYPSQRTMPTSSNVLIRLSQFTDFSLFCINRYTQTIKRPQSVFDTYIYRKTDRSLFIHPLTARRTRRFPARFPLPTDWYYRF